MNRQENCDIIRDLLPGYIDGILSDAGTKTVKEHMEGCAACRQACEEMKEKLDGESEPQEQLALDGFKKVRRTTRQLKLAAGLAGGLLIFVVLTIFIRFFVVGAPLSTHELTAEMVIYDEETESLEIKGTINLAGTRVSRVEWKPSEEDSNAVNVLVYGADTLPFGREKRDFALTIPNMKGKRAYLACPDYDQLQIYNWKYGHYEELQELEDAIYEHFPQLHRTRDALSYNGGIDVIKGTEGVSYSVDSVIGEDASFWWFNDQLVTDGVFDVKPFEIWISLEQPHEILILDYQTGEYTKDYPEN